MYLGIPSLLYDSDKQRRSLYGKAGSFRLQPWGLEYRSLSSAMMSSAEYLEFVYNQVAKAIYAYNKLYQLIDYNTIQICINNSDVALARQLVNTYQLTDIYKSIKTKAYTIIDNRLREFLDNIAEYDIKFDQ